MNLSECSDQEINMQVAKIELPGCICQPCHPDTAKINVFWPPKPGSIIPSKSESFDWINDDALAFRLLDENDFEIENVGGNKHVFYSSNGETPCASTYNKNLKRAICEAVILKDKGVNS